MPASELSGPSGERRPLATSLMPLPCFVSPHRGGVLVLGGGGTRIKRRERRTGRACLCLAGGGAGQGRRYGDRLMVGASPILVLWPARADRQHRQVMTTFHGNPGGASSRRRGSSIPAVPRRAGSCWMAVFFRVVLACFVVLLPCLMVCLRDLLRAVCRTSESWFSVVSRRRYPPVVSVCLRWVEDLLRAVHLRPR